MMMMMMMIFSAAQNDPTVAAAMTKSGRAFHERAAATAGIEQQGTLVF